LEIRSNQCKFGIHGIGDAGNLPGHVIDTAIESDCGSAELTNLRGLSACNWRKKYGFHFDQMGYLLKIHSEIWATISTHAREIQWQSLREKSQNGISRDF
jgi:hypothetical protein